jgi:hypothetical protein
MNDPKAKVGNAVENGSGEPGAASVDKIRDILFGSQIKNYESRFARLEETLARETAELKETMRGASSRWRASSARKRIRSRCG